MYNFQHLADKHLSKVATIITPQDMRTIALQKLDINMVSLKNMGDSRRDDMQNFKVDVLRHWKNRSIGNNKQACFL